jgi:hypothetical protein
VAWSQEASIAAIQSNSRSIHILDQFPEPDGLLIENIDEQKGSDGYGDENIGQCHDYQKDQNLCVRIHDTASCLLRLSEHRSQPINTVVKDVAGFSLCSNRVLSFLPRKVLCRPAR